jgi:reductive dehalogenase
MHPERIKLDQRLRTFIETINQPEHAADPLDSAFYRAVFDPAVGLALPDVADGEVAPVRVEGDPLQMAARIKVLGRQLGADDVRIGPLNPAWVYSHRGTPPFFDDYTPNPPHLTGLPEGYSDLRWGDPIEIDHRYAIVMAFGQDLDLIGTGGTPFSELEIGRVYAFSALVATHIAAYIRALGWSARAHHLRNYGVLMVPVAVDAGMGELGRCGFLLHPRLGANLRLVCVTTDLPLELDPPVDLKVQDFCEVCLKCADNCPSGSIPRGEKTVVRGVKKWQIKPERCLNYWGHLGSACSICQSVCPWSKPPTPPHRLVAQIAFRFPALHRLLVWADDGVYGKDFRAKPVPEWPRP